MSEADTPEVEEEADVETAVDALELKLSPTRLTLSSKNIVVNWRLALRNLSDRHIVSLRIWSDLSSAKRTAISHDQAGTPDMDRAKLQVQDLIEPGDRAECLGEWQFPRNEALPVKHGPVQNFKEPKVLPIARFRLIGAGIAPSFVNFAIGTPAANDGALPEPLLFNEGIRLFSRLAAVQLD